MIFTENRYDQSIERMMKGIPNFYPQSSGIVVTGKIQYTAEMCDCKLCGEYVPKKGCGVPRCVCLEERAAVGVASVKEVMNDTTLYFEDLLQRLNFKNWFFGHYHEDRKIMDQFILLYDQIIRII